MYHELQAIPDAVQWGYFDKSIDPVLTIESGDIVSMECLSHHAGEAPDLIHAEFGITTYPIAPGPEGATQQAAVAGPRHSRLLDTFGRTGVRPDSVQVLGGKLSMPGCGCPPCCGMWLTIGRNDAASAETTELE